MWFLKAPLPSIIILLFINIVKLLTLWCKPPMIYNYLVIFLLLSFYEWQIKLFCIVDYIHIVRQVLCPLLSLKWIICYQTLWLTRFIIFPTFPGHFYFWLTIKKLVSYWGEKITLSQYMSIRVIIISEKKFSVTKVP